MITLSDAVQLSGTAYFPELLLLLHDRLLTKPIRSSKLGRRGVCGPVAAIGSPLRFTDIVRGRMARDGFSVQEHEKWWTPDTVAVVTGGKHLCRARRTTLAARSHFIHMASDYLLPAKRRRTNFSATVSTHPKDWRICYVLYKFFGLQYCRAC